MTLYEFAKYLHILLSIAWLGGAFGMILLATLAAKRGDQTDLVAIARNTETLAKRVFVPSTVLILLLGLYMVWAEGSFLDAWVIIGLAGILMTGAIGGLFLTPLAAQVASMEPGADSAGVAEKLPRSARADLVMLAAIVWAIVSKPAWVDGLEIAAMITVIVIGGVLFLRK